MPQTLTGLEYQPPPRKPVAVFDHPHSKHFFPNIQSQSPLTRLCAVPLSSMYAWEVFLCKTAFWTSRLYGFVIPVYWGTPYMSNSTVLLSPAPTTSNHFYKCAADSGREYSAMSPLLAVREVEKTAPRWMTGDYLPHCWPAKPRPKVLLLRDTHA